MSSALPFELAAFAFGLLLGSFLNVCIARLPAGESLLHPRSHCLRCGQTIRWYDNIPVLSWLLLRARCRHCAATISWRYPLVEIGTAVWFLLAYLVTHHAILADLAAAGPDHLPRLLLDGVGTALLGFFLIGLMVIDWQTHTLPDALTLTGTAAGFVLTCAQAIFLQTGEDDIHFTPHTKLRMQSPGSFAARGDVFLTGPEALVLGRLGAILGAAGLLLLIRAVYKALRGREGMGLGDAKLLGMIAAFLGFGNAFLTFFLGMVACAAYAVLLLSRGRATAATKLPLGSFLCGAGLVNALLGEAVLTWYRGLL
jgi:leader peptidase (prepilin peptidase) / N-methyltransferase